MNDLQSREQESKKSCNNAQFRNSSINYIWLRRLNNIKEPPAKVDDYLLQLITQQIESQKAYEKQLFSEAINPTINHYKLHELTKLQIKEESIKTLVQSFLADGFKLSSSEGMFYIEIDYPQIMTKYGPYASNQMSGYLQIMARETAKHFAEDAALIISPDELRDRIVAIENFSQKNPRFQRLAEVKKLDKMYRPAYLIGLNNTPAFNYQTNRLTEPFLKSFQSTVTKYPNSDFSRLIQDYLKVLQKNGYRKTQEVLEFAL